MSLVEFVSLRQLAEAMEMDKSAARKYILKQGIRPEKRRTADSRGQPTLSFTKEEAERIIAVRRDQGFFGASFAKPVSEETGFFYVIQVVPELDPNRVKLGFASDIDNRLQSHRTSAPTAIVARKWPSRKSWEVTAISAMTAVGCRLISGEVFECDELDQLLLRGDRFFGLLPKPDFLVPLAGSSPLREQTVDMTKEPENSDETELPEMSRLRSQMETSCSSSSIALESETS